MAKPKRRSARGDDKLKRVLTIAREQFGFEKLRFGQQEGILALLDRRDALVIQPTGSGKSAIYQIAGLLIDGPTVVISPLIALQKDQMEAIRENELAEVAVVNSHQPVARVREAFDKLKRNQMEYLFLAPEQLHKPETRAQLKGTPPSLFVVDEAHCISEWGHDFRPDYMRLGGVIEELGHPTVLALTATASPRVRNEIVQRLGMRDPLVLVRGFDRPNIWLGVETFIADDEKRQAILRRVQFAPKPGIIYTGTRKHAEDLASELGELGVKAVSYHAGMAAKRRHDIQEAFMSGDTETIVATNAFGMGIDKSDVRFVYHFDIPDSLDSYYQEIGRCGRDGKPAEAILFYRPEDLRVPRFLKSGGRIEEERVLQVERALKAGREPVDIRSLQDSTKLSVRKVEKIVNRLEKTGAVERFPNGQIALADDAPDFDQSAHLATMMDLEHRKYDAERLEKMQTYAEMRECRRAYLLSYFGDQEIQSPCRRCDNCDRLSATQ